jgi:hypothetical protein
VRAAPETFPQLSEVTSYHAIPAAEAAMSDETRAQRRGRPRRRQDGGGAPRRQQPRPAFQRRNNFSSGQYSSIYAGPFPTDDFEGGMNLADLQAKDVEELREMAA